MVITSCDAVAATTLKLLLAASVKPAEFDVVTLYPEPTLLSEQLKVATPAVTVTGPVPPAHVNVLDPGLLDSARLTVVVLSVLTVFPTPSFTATTNDVDAPAAMFAPAAGWVVKANLRRRGCSDVERRARGADETRRRRDEGVAGTRLVEGEVAEGRDAAGRGLGRGATQRGPARIGVPIAMAIDAVDAVWFP